jgi:tripartite-type tricarboxylate transporter receptor subunit TctC
VSPALLEFAKDQRTRDVLGLTLAPMGMDRPILAPPGTPKDIVAALRKAFHDTMNDPAFVAEAERQHIEIAEVDGDKIARLLQGAYALPPDVVKAANEAMALTGAGE